MKRYGAVYFLKRRKRGKGNSNELFSICYKKPLLLWTSRLINVTSRRFDVYYDANWDPFEDEKQELLLSDFAISPCYEMNHRGTVRE